MVSITITKTNPDGSQDRKITIDNYELSSDCSIGDMCELFESVLLAFGYQPESIARHMEV